MSFSYYDKTVGCPITLSLGVTFFARRTGFSLTLFCGPALKILNALAHANLLQLVSHRGTDSVRDLGLPCRNKMLRPVGIMVVNGTRSVFIRSVVPVTFRPIWPWFRTAR